MISSLAIEQKRQELIKQYGEWQGENFQLIEDIYTRGKTLMLTLIALEGSSK